MTRTILQTKLFIPPVRPELIPRLRLLTKLNAGLHGKLTLVSAPAGFGKTSLIVEWVSGTLSTSDPQASNAPRFCWLSLDNDDNELARFFTYFIAALQMEEDSWGQAAISLLQSPQTPPPENIITLLINDLAFSPLRSPIILVLDDYHVIRNQAIHQALTFLLNNAPPDFQLAITTRSDPPLPLSQMRVRGEITEIREADLRFTVEETAAFLNQMPGVDLPAEEIAALASRTEGWIAALQLAALALQAQDSAQQADFIASFSGGHAHVVDYLMEEVWQHQAEEVQHFWLATSVLDRLSGPLCDAITGREDSEQLLSGLHQRNLFLVPLDSQRQWYRYHRLFGDMLRNRATTLGPVKITQLHQRAAHWYEQQRLLPQAIHHALAADDRAEATRLISLATAAALRRGDLAAIQGWLEALPAAHVRAQHQLALAKAWVSYLRGQIELAAACLADAQLAWPDAAEPEQQVSLISLQAFIAILQGDIPTGVSLSHEALALATDEDDHLRELILFNLMQVQAMVDDIDAAVQSGRQAVRVGLEIGSSFLAANVLEGLLQLYLLQGKLREAIRLGQEAVNRFVDKRNKPLPIAGQLTIALGQAHFESGDIDRAYTLMQQGIALGEQMAAIMPVLNGKLRLAQVQQSRGEGELAVATLGEVRQMADLPHLQPILDALEAEINLRQRNIAAALAWANSADIPSLEAPAPRFEIVYLAYARCMLADRRWSKADALLAKLAGAAKAQGRAGSLAPIMVLQALSKQAQGQRSAAKDRLRQAVEIAAPEGHERPFLDDLPHLIPLLQAVHSASADFVAGLLSRADLSASTLPQSLLPDPLNERETEVLRLIAAGLSNPEIARELYLAVNTIKWYVKSIFQKLDVSSRKEAAARARELNLLP
jgi:LuxR family maltose regulon positive regulatory protein